MSGRLTRLKPRPVAPPAPGRDDAWSQMSTLVAGPVAWGLIGFGVDELTGSPVFLPVGIVIGFAASLWLVFHRYTQGIKNHASSTTNKPGTAR
jgi:F0F1-type ATP synthase assembly protein I